MIFIKNKVRRLRIVVLGTRGFPDVQGGVEKHCQELYLRLVKLGCEVTVFARAAYVEKKGDRHYFSKSKKWSQSPFFYQGVRIVPLWCPRSKFLEAFVHTLIGVFAAGRLRPDVLHVHAVGPALFVPLARLLGMRVVMTHHGPDYERKKWNRFAKAILRAGEWCGVRAANKVVCISGMIAEGVKARYGRQAVVIPNGVVMPLEAAQAKGDSHEKRDSHLWPGLEAGMYVLAVGRFVPEKGFGDLVEAFGSMRKKMGSGTPPAGGEPDPIFSWKLVIVGDADHEDVFSRQLKQKARDAGVVLTGRLTGKDLQDMYGNAGLFVLPSYYEGLPIVLLEALSYGLSCVVSDIPANREVGLADERYFKPGDVPALAGKVRQFSARPLSEEERQSLRSMVAGRYNWDKIAAETLRVYQVVV